MTIIVGCDCGKSEVFACVMSSSDRPSNLKQYGRSYKPLRLKPTAKDIEALIAINADAYAIEPTGSYSYLWIEALEQAGKQVLIVSSARVRNFCRYQGLDSKSDRYDAAAIAMFALDNFNSPDAFLNIERLRIRELYLNLNSTIRSRNPLQNRLGQRLGYECPEILGSYENSDRPWLKSPPATIRAIAGEELTTSYSQQRREKMDNTIGRGISAHTRSLAQQLVQFHHIELELEQAIAAEMSRPEFDGYHRVFDRFEMPPKTRAAILSRIYPFEQFLDPATHKPIREYVYGENSKRPNAKTKRDRSEGAFKLSLGMGKILHQSGSNTSWKAGGSKYARTALWLYTSTIIVIHRKRSRSNGTDFITAFDKAYKVITGDSPWLNDDLIRAIAYETNSTLEVAALRIHYHCTDFKKGDRRISGTAGRLTRMLYKSLVQELTS